MEKPSLTYGLIVSFVFLMMVFVTLETSDSWMYLSIIVATGGVFTFLKSPVGFILLITEVIAAGFLLTFEAYQAGLASMQQLPLVLDHVLFAAMVTVLWIILFLVKRDEGRLAQMKQELAELKRFEDQTNVFTKREFMEKAKVIWTGLKRRNEQGLILFITIAPTLKHSEQALMKTIGNTLMTTVRGDFDVVGKYDRETFIVLLQNTNEQGREIVLARFRKLLENEVEHPERLFAVVSRELDDAFFEADADRSEAQ
ncbi:diguanylate cyclase [Salimicrobium sp. PL1-032A]|uniref:GGDEF domain-containing protein n=1 Tax=Salimicrobium sp. PL1-032A TaxID=3095364 RepID=UPI0032615C11